MQSRPAIIFFCIAAILIGCAQAMCKMQPLEPASKYIAWMNEQTALDGYISWMNEQTALDGYIAWMNEQTALDGYIAWMNEHA